MPSTVINVNMRVKPTEEIKIYPYPLGTQNLVELDLIPCISNTNLIMFENWHE